MNNLGSKIAIGIIILMTVIAPTLTGYHILFIAIEELNPTKIIIGAILSLSGTLTLTLIHLAK